MKGERIKIKKRNQEEIEAYQEGFIAGVQMCQNAINDNYARYREMVQSVVLTMEIERDKEDDTNNS